MEEVRSIDVGDVRLSVWTWGDWGAREPEGAGDEAGGAPLVLCAHGFPDGPRSFREQVAALVKAGFRVAAPAMRGYSPSGVPESGRYDAGALGRDLVKLAEALAPGQKVRLVGHDWGAVAAYAATALAPERFSHVVTMAVPHARAIARNGATAAQARRSWYMGLFQLPVIAERRLAADDLALVDRLWRDWSPGFTPEAAEMAAVKDGIRDRIGPVIGYYRALRAPGALFGEARRLLFARTAVRAMYLHGVDDGCMGVEVARGMERDFEAGVEVYRIEGAGHFLHVERPEVVNPLLVAFLSGG